MDVQRAVEILRGEGYKAAVAADDLVIVRDPVRVNGVIAEYKEHRIHLCDTGHDLWKFLSDRS